MGVDVLKSDIKGVSLVLATLEHLARDSFDYRKALPSTSQLLEEMRGRELTAESLGRERTKEEELKATALIDELKDEMVYLETAARQHDFHHLKDAQKNVSHILVISRPGTYTAARKEVDKAYAKIPSLYGADRLNSDRAFLLGLQIALLRANYNEDEIRRLDHIAILGMDDIFFGQPQIGKELLDKSGIKFVYAGRPMEVEATRKVVSVSKYISSDRVDFLDTTGERDIVNTYDQALAYKRYFEEEATDVTGLLVVTDALQLPRFTRMAEKMQMAAETVPMYAYPRPTSRNGFSEYAGLELKGNAYYILTGKESSKKAGYKVI